MPGAVSVAAPIPAIRFPLLEPLADRNFALFWAGRTVSLCGDQFQTVALAIVAIDLTHSASGLGTVLAVQGIPRALLMLFGGVATDRFRARNVMLASDTLQTLVVTALALLAFTGHLSLPVLLGYAALSGAATAVLVARNRRPPFRSPFCAVTAEPYGRKTAEASISSVIASAWRWMISQAPASRR